LGILVHRPGLQSGETLLIRGGTTSVGLAEASDDVLTAHVRCDIGTVFHPVGTVSMGAADDPDAAVDPNLKFKGVVGLRVADASVMPSLIRGHTMAPTVFIGHRAADLISDGF
jgi:choline dehydrogenase